MEKYKVVEIFESINGEGMKAGELAVFVRLQGCNLACSYCDTAWANQADAIYREMTLSEIETCVEHFGAKNVTLTGGEPLLQKDVSLLLKALSKSYDVEIETNGSVFLKEFRDISSNIIFTMDYKLAGSGMEDKMCLANFELLRESDTVKFVVSSLEDLSRAYEVEQRYGLGTKCHVLISPVFGKIEPADMVAFMIEKKWVTARMQIQMHKVIWNPDKRGV